MLNLALDVALTVAEVTYLGLDRLDLFFQRGVILHGVQLALAGVLLLRDAELREEVLDPPLLRGVGTDASRPLGVHALGPLAQRVDVQQVHDAQARHGLCDLFHIILKDKDIDLGHLYRNEHCLLLAAHQVTAHALTIPAHRLGLEQCHQVNDLCFLEHHIAEQRPSRKG